MPLKEPRCMDECFYFTNRDIDSGHIIAWVFRPDCPKCKKAKLGKPVVKGKVQKKSDIYVCPACGYTVAVAELEPTLTLNIKYTCPYCGKAGETTAPYKRKKFQGIDAYVFECQFCKKKIPITKKMKELKEESYD